MKELEKLEKSFNEKIEALKGKENKTAKEQDELKKTQRRLRELHRVMIQLKEMK
ncbi:MAG: hypothetical protein J6Y42_05025 [Bacilli bacterium]|nr:hypothetical protein [Bacilli bacterium]